MELFKNKTFQIIAIACVFFGIIGLSFLFALLPKILGKPYIIEIEGYDPRDLFLGNYVAIMPIMKKKEFSNKLPCDKVFTPLLLQEDFYILDGNFSCTPPQNLPYIQAKKTIYGLSFGFENYYVSPSEAKRIEKILQQERLKAKIWIYKGKARMEEIIFNSSKQPTP
ncbi:hypothetical protein CQA57_07130 [Helicobacter anseris]|uniref:GDYXXLXY protein n=1 Tax=Helicobacter anseris TaxID=375926 RepID=A0A3D8J3E4_9HELI|nr:GDYXXLXY domain-containing protein [Helicobacter anseris]RDU72008.1 hypothetical protein CQA57_07130 [Helicobacter anseris]